MQSDLKIIRTINIRTRSIYICVRQSRNES